MAMNQGYRLDIIMRIDFSIVTVKWINDVNMPLVANTLDLDKLRWRRPALVQSPADLTPPPPPTPQQV